MTGRPNRGSFQGTDVGTENQTVGGDPGTKNASGGLAFDQGRLPTPENLHAKLVEIGLDVSTIDLL